METWITSKPFDFYQVYDEHLSAEDWPEHAISKNDIKKYKTVANEILKS